MSFGQFFKVHCVAKKVAAFLLGDVYHPAHGHFAHLPLLMVTLLICLMGRIQAGFAWKHLQAGR